MHLIAEIHQPYLKKEGYPHRHLFLSMPVAACEGPLSMHKQRYALIVDLPMDRNKCLWFSCSRPDDTVTGACKKMFV